MSSDSSSRADRPQVFSGLSVQDRALLRQLDEEGIPYDNIPSSDDKGTGATILWSGRTFSHNGIAFPSTDLFVELYRHAHPEHISG